MILLMDNQSEPIRVFHTTVRAKEYAKDWYDRNYGVEDRANGVFDAYVEQLMSYGYIDDILDLIEVEEDEF